MLVKTNVDISIKINHGNRHFVEMFRRRESGTGALIGQTQQISLYAYGAFGFHTTQANASISASTRKWKNFDPPACVASENQA